MQSYIDQGTLADLTKELSRAVKKNDEAANKILNILLKQQVMTKEDLQKSGISKLVLQIQKTQVGDIKNLAQQIIAKWKTQFKPEPEPKKDFKNYSTGVKHRDSIIDKFEQSLKTVGELDEDLKAEDLEDRARDVAINLEAAICKVFGPTSKDYSSKARSLLYNMQDKMNVGLRLKLMAGVFEPI